MSALPVAPFVDLSSFLSHLERTGSLHRVSKLVDRDWEIACLARWAMESTPEQECYALLYKNVKNQSVPMAVNLFSTAEMYGPALHVHSDELLMACAKAL